MGRHDMDIQLKNVKIYGGLSQETVAFSASLYVDAKKVGETRNAGHGGSNDVDVFDKDLMDKMESEAATHTWSYQGETHNHNLDSYIGDLVDTVQERRDKQRLCRGKTLAQLPGTEYAEGEWSVFKAKFTPVVATSIRTRYGQDTKFLNEEVK
tara:strand:- start:383 stop:841 length:459 start_codon:yes stop_codon:yes gene_type:complete